jgi:hypothetical protein
LEPFDDDKLIPTFGYLYNSLFKIHFLTFRFGDVTTQDKTVAPFFPDRPCHGFEEVLRRYTEITPHIQLSGPTSFAPLIRGIDRQCIIEIQLFL